jgi:hypothetical protein
LITFRSDEIGQPSELLGSKANNLTETLMKKLFLAVALVVAFAAPAMAEQFGNPYTSAYIGR